MNQREQARERRERIEFLWLAGWKAEAIAAEIGVSRGVICRHAMELGLPPRRPGLRVCGQLQRDMWPVIFRWLRAGRGLDEIKGALGYRQQLG
jgi:hypothetical protein